MNPLILVIVGLVFTAVLVVGLAIMADERRLRVQERVQQLRQRPRSPIAEELALPFHERVLKPIAGRFINAIGAMAPAEALETARQELEKAGHPMGLNAQSFMTLRIFSAVAGLGAAIWLWNNPILGATLQVPVAGFAAVAGLLAPHYMLQKSIEGRHAMVRKALPDVIDLLVVSVEAGAGLDGALAEVVQRKDGPLVDEFKRLLGEVRVGKTRKRAWQDMADRVGEDNLNALVGSLAQAEQLGVSIAKALRTQSDSLRTRRSLQIKEVAAALPVKMLFPLIFFIFPALFVILLGPGLMSMTSVLGALGGGQ
ncbi:MAG: type II secretion system F family protein [candidate division WS1 bacterium]|jgi:tight adherence protein C|nr:type II secretion system F family protein [candidate division WS1 bacterium]